MKRIKTILTSIMIILTLNACGQSNHNELNGIFSKGGNNLYFKDGNCYFFNQQADNTFRREEHYPYKYTDKKIVFKYTGDFKQEYNGSKVAKVWWRLSDDRIRDRMAYIRVESLNDWYNKKYKNFASNYTDKIYTALQKEIPTLSKAQFTECLDHKSFVEHIEIENYAMNEEFSINDIVIRIYNDLKKSNKLQNTDAVISVKKEASLNTNHKIKWSDWVYIKVDEKSDVDGTFTFGSYFFPGEELTVKEKLFRPKKKPSLDLFIDAELFKDNKLIGRYSGSLDERNTGPSERSLTQSMWHNIGGTLHNGGKKDEDGRFYKSTKWKDLSNGDYQIKITINEKEGAIRTKNFFFKISNDDVKGDDTITKNAFKKKHDISHFDGEYIFLSAAQ